MNLVETFQDLVAHVPEILQPIIIALAGAVPFIEGEGAVSIGIIGGMNPIVAGIAAALGSLACVFVVVLLSSTAREAIVAHRDRSRAAAASGGSAEVDGVVVTAEAAPETGRKAARRAKFQRAFDRYGVPGVSLLGPLVLPPAFTAPMLIAVGTKKNRVLLWQAISIILWVVVFAVLFSLLVNSVA